MDLEIQGGYPLSGTWEPQGSKNEAAMVLAAALLTDQTVRIRNCPRTSDIDVLLDLLDGLGAHVTFEEPNACTILVPEIKTSFLETPRYERLFSSVRVSVNLIGPLLARQGFVRVSPPGGDRIGSRKLDTLLNGLQALGYLVSTAPDGRSHYIHAGQRHSASVFLDQASVTGTAALLMASALCPEPTEIFHAACEPDVEQLCRMLVSMGVGIRGLGSNRLFVEGDACLRGCAHAVAPDIIEIGSIITVAAATRSVLTIPCPTNLMLTPILRSFERLGVNVSLPANSILISGNEVPVIERDRDQSPISIADGVWPAFPTDLLGLALTAATVAEGSAMFHQRLYERRLFFVSQLQEMGARIILCDPHRAFVMGLGRERLRGSRLQATDIRSAMALLAAALGAEGTSVLEGMELLDRGYTRIDHRLRALGARIGRR